MIATDSRGNLMGNRGCLHDDRQRIRRPFVGKRWILCLLEFKGRRRRVMAPGRYTELFFLDEATGLAAGHRPCAECQRQRFGLFRDAWAAANPALAGSPAPSADVIDAALHAERLGPRGEKQSCRGRLSTLPFGAMVLLEEDERPFLVLKEALAPWSPAGYGPAVAKPAEARVGVLTPRSVVRALAWGYPVTVHPSAGPG
jgi:hypothetical protein